MQRQPFLARQTKSSGTGSDVECHLNFRPFCFPFFQHEEVQFLENELENQKQKYQELANYTKSLLSAVRNHDLERQQVKLTLMLKHWRQAGELSARRNDLSEMMMVLCLGARG